MTAEDVARTTWAVAALDHRFDDPGLLAQALTHSSMGVAGRAYDRLEFLGDRVLGLGVAALLYRTFPAETEGALARRLAELVRREALAAIAAELDLEPHVAWTREPDDSRARARQTVLADALEAVLGAVFLDGGWQAAYAAIARLWTPRIAAAAGPPQDAKTRLQEWAQARRFGLPAYAVQRREGPDHAPLFEAEVSVTGSGAARGSGASKRIAEQAAAARLLAGLGEGEGP